MLLYYFLDLFIFYVFLLFFSLLDMLHLALFCAFPGFWFFWFISCIFDFRFTFAFVCLLSFIFLFAAVSAASPLPCCIISLDIILLLRCSFLWKACYLTSVCFSNWSCLLIPSLVFALFALLCLFHLFLVDFCFSYRINPFSK